MCIRDSNITKNGFSKAYNAGPIINTDKDEMSPFIHSDNLNLYFSSKGHVGMGNYDLFVSKRKNIYSDWEKPNNLGYPINDHKSQNSLVVSSDGKTAYFNSSFEGFGSDDIFYFKLPENVQAKQLNNIELDIIISKPGEEIVLNNVQFSNNSYELNEMSKNELDKLSNYLIKYNINIQIEGHTDSNGDSALNLILSENRAKSTAQYVISKGIDENRISGVGKGENEPVIECSGSCSNEDHRTNRRSEFIIL